MNKTHEYNWIKKKKATEAAKNNSSDVINVINGYGIARAAYCFNFISKKKPTESLKILMYSLCSQHKVSIE